MRLATAFQDPHSKDIHTEHGNEIPGLVFDTGRCRIGACDGSFPWRPLIKVGEGVEID